MKPHTIGRIISAVIFGVLLTWGMHLDELKRGQMGREQFLAKQAARFDKHFAKPDPIAIELIVCVFIAGTIFGGYELVAFGVSKALKKVGDGEERS